MANVVPAPTAASGQTGPPSTTGIDDLPMEILAEILSLLDGPAPSDSRLRDQPVEGFLNSEAKNVKAASSVSRRWRAASLSILYRHVIWPLNRWDLILAGQEDEPGSAIPFVKFLRDNRLGGAVRTLTMLVRDSSLGFYSRHLQSAGGYTINSGRLEGWERAGRPGLRLVAGIGQKSVTYRGDHNWLWHLLFDLVDPLRFTIVASPEMLAALLSRMLFVSEVSGFRVPFHVLSLSRKARHSSNCASREHVMGKGKGKAAAPMGAFGLDSGRSAASTPRPSPIERNRVPCDLFTIRPWTALLLNEGSSTPIYRTLDFFHKRAPSILGALLGAEEFPNDEALMPPSVREMDYIGIFPLSSHVNTLVMHLPRIDRLFIQLVPQNDMMNDREEMRLVAQQDLWMERNTSYSLLMREMLQFPQSGNWEYLREFESGDAADHDGWEMAVEYVRLAGQGWHVAGEGLFVKSDPDLGATAAPEHPPESAVSPSHNPLPSESDPAFGGQQTL